MDFTQVCWFCGRNTMVKQDGFYACEECGATWNEVPKPASSPIVKEKVPGYRFTQYRLRKRRVVGVGKKIRKEKDAINI